MNTNTITSLIERFEEDARYVANVAWGTTNLNDVRDNPIFHDDLIIYLRENGENV